MNDDDMMAAGAVDQFSGAQASSSPFFKQSQTQPTSGLFAGQGQSQSAFQGGSTISSNNLGFNNNANNTGNRFGANLPFAKPSPFTSGGRFGGAFQGGMARGPQSELSGVSVTLEKFSADDLGVDDDLGLAAASKTKQMTGAAGREDTAESLSRSTFDALSKPQSLQFTNKTVDEDSNPATNPFFNIPETLPNVSPSSFEDLSILGLVPERPPRR
jgi:hypothetical protein